jgi:TolA-binding protein
LRHALPLPCAVALLIAAGAALLPFGGTARAQSDDERAFQFAERLYRDGLFELAHEQFEGFVSEHPGSRRLGEAMLLGADCLVQLDRQQEALDLYERITRRFRQGPFGCEAAYKRAAMLAELDRPGEALRAFDVLKGSYPDCARRYDAEVAAADALIVLGRPDEALARLADLPGDPERPAMLARTAYVRARALEAAGERGNALAAYDAVVQLFPATVWEDRSHLRRAELLAGEGYHAEALDELGLVGAHGHPEATALRAEALLARAGIEARLGRHEDAGGSYAAAAELLAEVDEREAARPAPGDRRGGGTTEPAGQAATVDQAWAEAALAYERAGERKRALEMLSRLARPTSDPRLGLRMALVEARVAREARERDRARGALDRLESLAAVDTLAPPVQVLADSLAFEGLLLRAAVETDDGRAAAAAHLLRRWNPDGQPAMRRARLARRLGDIELEALERPLEARGAYRMAVAAWEAMERPAPPELWIRLGRAEEALAHYDAAREAYRAAYVDRPGHALSSEARAREAYVRDYLDVDWQMVAGALSELAEQALRGELGERAALERLARLHEQQSKRYEKALRLYEELLAGGGAETGDGTALDRASLLDHAGRVAMLAARARGDEDEPDAGLLARGRAHFEELVTDFPESDRADDARLVLIEAEFGRPDRDRHGDRRLSAEAAAYQQFFEVYPHSDRRADVLARLGAIYRDAAEAAGGDSTSYAVARDYYATIVRQTPDSKFMQDAVYWRAVMSERLGDSVAAAAGFGDYLRLFPRGTWSPECHFELGELAIADRRLEDAAKHYEWIVSEAGTHRLAAHARARLGDCALLAGDTATARARYEALIAADPDGPLADEAVLRLADVSERAGEWGAAQAELTRLLADYPESGHRAEVFLRLGRLRQQRGDATGAADALERFLDTRPAPDPAVARGVRFELAEALRSAEQPERALDVYEDLAARADGDTAAQADAMRARAERVMLLYDLDREKDARRSAERFAKEHPDATGWQLEIAVSRGNYLLRHDPGAARAHFETLLAEHGDGPAGDRILYGLGLTAMRAQDWEETISRLETLVERYPESRLRATSHFKLGTAYYTLERYNDAAGHYAEARRLADDPDMVADASRNLGLALERADRYDQAVRVYRELARDHADTPLGLYGAFKIGFVYQEWGKLEQAIAAYREVLPRQSGIAAAETQFWIAECYETAGKLETAVAEYLKVGYLHPDSGMWAGTARYRAGGIYEQMGRPDEAQAIYTALAADDPGGEWGGRAAERLELLSQDPNQD